MKVMEEINRTGITEDELKDAKAQLIGNFPRSVETVGKLGYNLLILYGFGLNESYLKNFLKDVDKITLERVNQLLATQFKVSDYSILVYADKKHVQEQLKDMNFMVEDLK